MISIRAHLALLLVKVASFYLNKILISLMKSLSFWNSILPFLQAHKLNFLSNQFLSSAFTFLNQYRRMHSQDFLSSISSLLLAPDPVILMTHYLLPFSTRYLIILFLVVSFLIFKLKISWGSLILYVRHPIRIRIWFLRLIMSV